MARQLTEAQALDSRRRHDAATAALGALRSHWERLDQIEKRKKEATSTWWRKAEIALFFGGALLGWFLADGRKWDFNAGTFMALVAAWTWIIHVLELSFLGRERERLGRQAHALLPRRPPQEHGSQQRDILAALR
jgi:hypothetical protein